MLDYPPSSPILVPSLFQKYDSFSQSAWRLEVTGSWRKLEDLVGLVSKIFISTTAKSRSIVNLLFRAHLTTDELPEVLWIPQTKQILLSAQTALHIWKKKRKKQEGGRKDSTYTTKKAMHG